MKTVIEILKEAIEKRVKDLKNDLANEKDLMFAACIQSSLITVQKVYNEDIPEAIEKAKNNESRLY